MLALPLQPVKKIRHLLNVEYDSGETEPVLVSMLRLFSLVAMIGSMKSLGFQNLLRIGIMRPFSMCMGFVLLLCFPQGGLAIEPVDTQINAAMDDMTRIEAQFSKKTTTPDSAVYRALKLLQLTRERLDTSNNQSHESWRLADSRLNNLVNTLQSKLMKKAQATSSAPVLDPPKNSPLPTTSIEHSPPTQGAMISQDRARIKKLTRDIVSATETLDQGGPKPFQDSEYVKQYLAAAARFHQSLQGYSGFAQDSDVQQATAELQKFDGMIRFGKDQASVALEELGDVQARLTDLQVKIYSRRPPPTPGIPYTGQDMTQWIAQAKVVRTAAISDFRQLKVIQEKAWLPATRGTLEEGAAFDSQDVSRLMNTLQQDVRSIDDTLKQLEANVQVQVEATQDTLKWFRNLDPTNQQSLENDFLGKGREAESIERLDRELHIVEAGIALDTLLKRETLAQRQTLRDAIIQAKTRYRTQRAEALQSVRMPKAASTNAELLRIAQETLAKPKYEIGNILKLVINSDKVAREKETSEIEIDEVDVRLSGDLTLSGTKTTTHYEWEQFQVATAEPADDAVYIFYHTLKYFTAGASTTPLNRWVLSQRIQGSEIPKANLAGE